MPVSDTLLGLGGQGGGGAPSASRVLLGQGADAASSASVELFDLGHGGGGAPSARRTAVRCGQGGGGAPSATRELLGFGHGGGGAPSATTARLLPMVWISVKAANNEKAANTTTEVVRFIVTSPYWFVYVALCQTPCRL